MDSGHSLHVWLTVNQFITQKIGCWICRRRWFQPILSRRNMDWDGGLWWLILLLKRPKLGDKESLNILDFPIFKAWKYVINGPMCPLFFNIDFPWLFHDQKMKIHDLSVQHLFPSKEYTTYECIPELVVTLPSACNIIIKKIKWFINWLYKWSRVTFTELLSAVVKIP